MALTATESGRIVLVGITTSEQIATPGTFDQDYGGVSDGYVASFDAYTGELLWASYLGGSNNDGCYDVAVTPDHALVVMGATSSSDIPVTHDAWDRTFNGGSDLFVAKITEDGSSLTWMTYVGGSGVEGAGAGCVGPNGQVYVCGETWSADWPVSTDGFDTSFNGQTDIGVVQLTADGTQVVHGTYFGGSVYDAHYGSNMCIDADGNVIIASTTQSSDLPGGGCGMSNLGAYVFKLSEDLCSFLGRYCFDGDQLDRAFSVITDAGGAIYVAGTTYSSTFPTTSDAYDRTPSPGGDIFLAVIDPLLQSTIYSTLLGGSSYEGAYACSVVLDRDNRVLLYSDTESPDYPVTPGVANELFVGPQSCVVTCFRSPVLPFVLKVADVPEDEGGVLSLQWPAFPSMAGMAFTEYRVERREESWATIAAMAATLADTQHIEVPTNDILVIGHEPSRSEYRVRGVVNGSDLTYVTDAISGYSVDNLPPESPQLDIYDDESQRSLVWQNPVTADFGQSCLYRGSVPNFEAGDPLLCSPTEYWYQEAHLALYYYRARSFDIHGNASEWSNEVVGRYPTGVPGVPTVLRLYPNQPNPFNPMTTLRFDVPVAGRAHLEVYDVAGRLIRGLLDADLPAGSHEAVWDGRDEAGRAMASGSYFARLTAGGKVETVRMGLVR